MCFVIILHIERSHKGSTVSMLLVIACWSVSRNLTSETVAVCPVVHGSALSCACPKRELVVHPGPAVATCVSGVGCGLRVVHARKVSVIVPDDLLYFQVDVLAGLFQLVLPMTRQEWASENRLWVIGVKEFLFLCKLTEHYRAQYSVCYKVLRTRHFLQTTENISSSKQPHNTKSCRINVHYIFCPHVSFEIKRDTPSRCKL